MRVKKGASRSAPTDTLSRKREREKMSLLRMKVICLPNEMIRQPNIIRDGEVFAARLRVDFDGA